MHTSASIIPRDHSAFALITTLIIVSVLAIVAVGFLSSMIGERQTADAYTSKARAEQASQAGVDGAIAMLQEAFRDYPDSATVWDPQQSSSGTNIYNSGTTLYIRAAPTPGSSGAMVPNPNPNPSGSSSADDPKGNGPNNLARSTFALPLVSGVPSGNAQLVSQKAAILPVLNYELDPAAQTIPTTQYGTDLNVRRYAHDPYGVIGSVPALAGASSTPGPTPQPAVAPWVNLKGSDGRVTGRYAFWIEDESFRANNTHLTNIGTPSQAPTPPDNVSRPQYPVGSGPYRSLLPSDLALAGPLSMLESAANAVTDASTINTARQDYPGQFFPDPLAFVHSDVASQNGTSSFTTAFQEGLRYLTTNQSGTLNLTRHGTQRLNLNEIVPLYTAPGSDTTAPPPATTIQTQVKQIVETLKFHLPYFGERFYRTANDLGSSTLNNPSLVPGSPKTTPYTTPGTADNSEIYYHKVAANIIDYLDNDSQPTVIDSTGSVLSGMPATAINHNVSSGTSAIWAQGKEAAPFLQEAAVRFRTQITPNSASVPHRFALSVDYYLEFWNMSDRDIYASPQGGVPNLHNAVVLVTNQDIWEGSPSPYGTVYCDDMSPRLSVGGTLLDYEIDLTNNVQLGGSGGPVVAGGVVFKAGALTVITTDPDCASYVFYGPPGQSSPSTSGIPYINSATGKPYGTNPTVTYYCPNLIKGTRQYAGPVPSGVKGIQQQFRGTGYQFDNDIEVTLCNAYGVIDSAVGAVNERYYGTTWYSDVGTTYPNYRDYSYGSSIMGNSYNSDFNYTAAPSAPSQLGDPRTNNEQLTITLYDTTKTGDQTNYIYGYNAEMTLGYPNGGSTASSPTLKPDQIGATGTTGYPWPDYYQMAKPQFPATVGAPSPMTAVNAPMVVADGPLSSIGQLGDVFDPARLVGSSSSIALSRGGGRTFKIGQRDDRYSGDPSGNGVGGTTTDAVPNSNAWAAWRLADVFSVTDTLELPARININGVRRDNGAALLAALTGFKFQPVTATSSPPTIDPVIHGDNHNASGSIAGTSLDTIPTDNAGFSQLISQMIARLNSTNPNPGGSTTAAYTPAGPFFERGELGELGGSTSSIFGMSDPMGVSQAGSSTALVSGVNMYQTFDHSREELFRRISELICTRGDTFTVYAVGQSIVQATPNATTMKVTGTHRTRVTFRLVPKNSDGSDFHPAYSVATGSNTYTPTYSASADVIKTNRFFKPDHYDSQVLSAITY